jgi:hypothetical protein
MYHDANNKVGMNTRTTALMAKLGVTTISALILLDKRGHVICTEGRGWCVADPKGLAFPWWEKPRLARWGGQLSILTYRPPSKVNNLSPQSEP